MSKGNIKLINIKNKIAHDGYINSLSVFPSGKIISVSADKSIKIWNRNLELIQIIEKAHLLSIIYVNILNENNFLTCSLDPTIKFWMKVKEEYILKSNIINAHKNGILKVLYYKDNNIISCSLDRKIKIWEKINEKQYQNNTILYNNHSIRSIYMLEDKNILIASGFDGTKFWNLNNFNMIFSINDANIYNYSETIKRIDCDRIILSNNNILKIISINEKKILKEINNEFGCFSILVLQNKGLFFTGGFSNDIKIYKCDNYECVDIEKNCHNNFIKGFYQLDNFIISYSYDRCIKIWSF